MIILWVKFLLNTFLHMTTKYTSGVSCIGLQNLDCKLTKRKLAYVLEEKSSKPINLVSQGVEKCVFKII